MVFATDDDGMLLWLSDRSQAAADFVKNYLLTHAASTLPGLHATKASELNITAWLRERAALLIPTAANQASESPPAPGDWRSHSA